MFHQRREEIQQLALKNDPSLKEKIFNYESDIKGYTRDIIAAVTELLDTRNVRYQLSENGEQIIISAVSLMPANEFELE